MIQFQGLNFKDSFVQKGAALGDPPSHKPRGRFRPRRAQMLLLARRSNPLMVEIRRGKADIEQLILDVMTLTKLNFNGAEICDGLPVTLRFVDRVGEILTGDPITPNAPLPFKFYI